MSDGDGGDAGGSGAGNGGLADFFWGTTNTGRIGIPHYYGDSVRQLLLGAAALMLIGSPFYSDNLAAEFPFIVIGALLAAALAAIINPRDRWISVVIALLSGAGVVVYAMWGMFGYEIINPVAFVLRLAVAVILLFVFYFSMKTMRAFMLHQVGKRETRDEFEQSDAQVDQEMLEEENVVERFVDQEREVEERADRGEEETHVGHQHSGNLKM